MTDRVRVGTALIADDSYMPATLVVGTEHYSAGLVIHHWIHKPLSWTKKSKTQDGHSSTWLARFAPAASASMISPGQIVLWRT
jgi:hypothetical protein